MEEGRALSPPSTNGMNELFHWERRACSSAICYGERKVRKQALRPQPSRVGWKPPPGSPPRQGCWSRQGLNTRSCNMWATVSATSGGNQSAEPSQDSFLTSTSGCPVQLHVPNSPPPPTEGSKGIQTPRGQKGNERWQPHWRGSSPGLKAGKAEGWVRLSSLAKTEAQTCRLGKPTKAEGREETPERFCGYYQKPGYETGPERGICSSNPSLPLVFPANKIT